MSASSYVICIMMLFFPQFFFIYFLFRYIYFFFCFDSSKKRVIFFGIIILHWNQLEVEYWFFLCFYKAYVYKNRYLDSFDHESFGSKEKEKKLFDFWFFFDFH